MRLTKRAVRKNTLPLSRKIREAARENAQDLFDAVCNGDKTDLGLRRLERDLKKGLTLRQLGLSKRQLGLIIRHV
jgi:hypothetical protein